jgi:hypothetical protein
VQKVGRLGARLRGIIDAMNVVVLFIVQLVALCWAFQSVLSQSRNKPFSMEGN